MSIPQGHSMWVYSLPVIAALIGWFTNYLAVKMLFHPREACQVFGLKIQGIFPKRQHALAVKLGEIVATELFSIEDVKEKLKHRALSHESLTVLETQVDVFLKDKLPSMIPMVAMFLNADMMQKIKAVLNTELKQALSPMIDTLGSEIEGAIDIKQTVQSKVEAFSSDKLEQILFGIMKKEFKFVEVVGAVLGFIIGLVQLLVMQI